MSKRTIATITVISIVLINTSGCILFDDFSGFRLINDNSDSGDGALSDLTNDSEPDADQTDSGSDVNQTDSRTDVNQTDSGTDINQTDSILDTTQSETMICDPSTCTQPNHGTAICTNNQCDVQCLSGCTKNGLSCDCPQPECCPDPNHPYDNPQCAGDQYQECVNGFCRN